MVAQSHCAFHQAEYPLRPSRVAASCHNLVLVGFDTNDNLNTKYLLSLLSGIQMTFT